MSIKVAVIGSREPTAEQKRLARILIQHVLDKGAIVNTGGADGIDNLAMTMAQDKCQVYLPWWSYNQEKIPASAKKVVYSPVTHNKWNKSVNKFHPNPHILTRGSRALHARNFGIIEAADLVIAFPSLKPGGGGTGQGIRIAQYLKKPITIITPYGTVRDSDVDALEHFNQLLTDKESEVNA